MTTRSSEASSTFHHKDMLMEDGETTPQRLPQKPLNTHFPRIVVTAPENRCRVGIVDPAVVNATTGCL
jgi:hypothetical protein